MIQLPLLIAMGTTLYGAGAGTTFRFEFREGDTHAGWIRVSPEMVYTKDAAYGFDLGTRPSQGKPFAFSVSLPEGNYNVSVRLGDVGRTCETTVKAESRRLMLERVRTEAGTFDTRTFT